MPSYIGAQSRNFLIERLHYLSLLPTVSIAYMDLSSGFSPNKLFSILWFSVVIEINVPHVYSNSLKHQMCCLLKTNE